MNIKKLSRKKLLLATLLDRVQPISTSEGVGKSIKDKGETNVYFNGSKLSGAVVPMPKQPEKDAKPVQQTWNLALLVAPS